MIPNNLLIATTNRGKIREIEALLKEDFPGLKLYSLSDLNITLECPEAGHTFYENAAAKSLFYSKIAKNILTTADDSGLVVEALNGQPGIHSARYAGADCDDEKNTAKLLRELKHVKNRSAKFVTAVVLSKNGKMIKSFNGEVRGTILPEKRGNSGFGYDPVFYYPPLRKTFAQLTTREKNRVSHRANALKKLNTFLSELL
ncbi:MAG: RdgB/HAM1 family non-canonical purine NTP pyrophosphatase [Candidatus Aminicenantes bacterium]|nr:RdgB/HAM1 family non-canonical purine NTP pyrophosphatase [Candidatus Aminicenantes bacterium]